MLNFFAWTNVKVDLDVPFPDSKLIVGLEDMA